ncbi:MAG: helix-turn-helix transcriptional regulator [Chloroflexi bacterium]|nr:helix-turn-helix transcriptional regulator [Chloroflexota bacterium]
MLRAKVKAQALWKIILRRNMTQNQLAKKAGITSGHLSQLINGDRLPSPAVRRKLLEALDPLEFDDIFEIQEVPGVRGDGAS